MYKIAFFGDNEMPDDLDRTALPIKLTQDDWILILHALKAYEHNARYRELFDRLNYQFTRTCAAA